MLMATVIAIEGTPAKQQTYKGSSRTSKNSSRDASNIKGVSKGRDATNSSHNMSIRDKHHQGDYYSTFGFSIMVAELLNFK